MMKTPFNNLGVEGLFAHPHPTKVSRLASLTTPGYFSSRFYIPSKFCPNLLSKYFFCFSSLKLENLKTWSQVLRQIVLNKQLPGSVKVFHDILRIQEGAYLRAALARYSSAISHTAYAEAYLHGSW